MIDLHNKQLSLFRQTGVKQRKLVGCDGVTSWNYPIVTKESYLSKQGYALVEKNAERVKER
jgi:hypothetical protein